MADTRQPPTRCNANVAWPHRLHAGALLVGKTNMDQFAAGLVGTRTPYPIPASAFDSRFIRCGGCHTLTGLTHVHYCSHTFELVYCNIARPFASFISPVHKARHINTPPSGAHATQHHPAQHARHTVLWQPRHTLHHSYTSTHTAYRRHTRPIY